MAGVKHGRGGGPKAGTEAQSSSPYISMFEGFRAELDEHHDRRERVIKASRDITAQSKKIIFALQRRAPRIGVLLPQSITKTTEPMLATIKSLFTSILPDLESTNAHRYQRNFTGGVQEYMEAVLFQYYLENGSLMTFQDAAKSVPRGSLLTNDDYVLGLFDMTGELMRFAITFLATNGALPESGEDQGITGETNILTDLQSIRAYLENFDARGSYSLSREFDKKLSVTRQSVEKVEYGVYSMLVRGKERPKGWRPDDAGVSGPSDPVEAY